MPVGVQHAEAALGGRGGDQVVAGGDAPLRAEVASRAQRGLAGRGGDRSLGEGGERSVDELEFALVPRRGEDLQRRRRAAPSRSLLISSSLASPFSSL